MNHTVYSDIRAMLDDASDGEFVFGQTATSTDEEHLEWLKNVLINTTDTRKEGGLWLVHIEEPKALTIAITGNGPKGKANALLLSNTKRIISYLLREIDNLGGIDNPLPSPSLENITSSSEPGPL